MTSLPSSLNSLQEMQWNEAQAEYGLLQCWGEKAMDQDQPTGKRTSTTDLNEEETEDPTRDKSKWGRPASKGGFSGGRGNGGQTPARQMPRRKQLTNDKHLEGMCLLMGRLLLRHEDQMNKSEHFIMFLRKESKVSMVPQFCPAVGTLARTARAEEGGDQLAAEGLSLPLSPGRASDPPTVSRSPSPACSRSSRNYRLPAWLH